MKDYTPFYSSSPETIVYLFAGKQKNRKLE